MAAVFLTTVRLALFAAHLFFSAATMAALPAALSLRLGMAVTLDAVSALLLVAHRMRCASPIRLRVAALIFRRVRFCGFDVPAGL